MSSHNYNGSATVRAGGIKKRLTYFHGCSRLKVMGGFVSQVLSSFAEIHMTRSRCNELNWSRSQIM